MERELVLPREPYENRHNFVREDVVYEAVKGFSKEGLQYGWIEQVELIRGIYKAKLQPTRSYNEFKEGVLNAIHTYWAWHYYNSVTGDLEKVDPEIFHDTVYADQIFFSAYLGEPVMNAMLNGAVRGPVMGFNDQPIVNPDGTWRPDVIFIEGTEEIDTERSYDTSKPADKNAYALIQPLYREVEQPALGDGIEDGEIIEETPTEEPTA